jgi:hypothetical protein
MAITLQRTFSDADCRMNWNSPRTPRATLESFMRNSADGVRAYRRGESAERILPLFRRAERTLDLSEVSPDRVDSVATEAGLLIYEVLNRVGQPDYTEIPGEEEVAREELESWTMPGTEISISRMKEGDHKGEFLFSAKTLARALDFYEKVKQLPHQSAYEEGSYEEYVTRPDFSVPYLWVDELPSWAKQPLFRNPAWKWLMLLVVLSGELDLDRVGATMTQLGTLLEENDTAARQVAVQLEQLLAGSNHAKLLKQLTGHIGEYDFEQALELLKDLKNVL